MRKIFPKIMSKSYLKWEVNKAFKKSYEYNANNKLALNLSKLGFKEIVNFYTYISPAKVKKIFKLSPDFSKLKGVGIDLGGGVGVISSTIARIKSVEKIFCVEIVENCVTKCHPIVKKNILNKNTKKVISVVGDFDNIKLPKESIDFAISWDSMHHSLNPTKTFSGIYKILKPGGFFIFVDRAHNNQTSNKDVKRMLDIEYSKEFKLANYIDPNMKLTRRMNGEHEYKFSDWFIFFKKSNFHLSSIVVLCSDPKMKKNDLGIKEIQVPFNMGAYFKRKVIFALRK